MIYEQQPAVPLSICIYVGCMRGKGMASLNDKITTKGSIGSGISGGRVLRRARDALSALRNNNNARSIDRMPMAVTYHLLGA